MVRTYSHCVGINKPSCSNDSTSLSMEKLIKLRILNRKLFLVHIILIVVKSLRHVGNISSKSNLSFISVLVLSGLNVLSQIVNDLAFISSFKDIRFKFLLNLSQLVKLLSLSEEFPLLSLLVGHSFPLGVSQWLSPLSEHEFLKRRL